jgi:hypothetical protein
MEYPVKVKYQLVQSIVGMYNDETEVTRIPAGAILEMPPTDWNVGIAEVYHNGRKILVFLHDLLETGRIEPDR